ncbi:hypothetical protein BDV96DRAFT_629623 [Lophiotrema nucula]|uniref:F-box domain-containing protein n=1 Tax=Lophiotrema nucula TaxID=690887 RepID=A0A6A5ZIJ8_9PLEO|nr:hypothetical protein BDV96DRAFT_629623 [Lophiotrema nucula]
MICMVGLASSGFVILFLLAIAFGSYTEEGIAETRPAVTPPATRDNVIEPHHPHSYPRARRHSTEEHNWIYEQRKQHSPEPLVALMVDLMPSLTLLDLEVRGYLHERAHLLQQFRDLRYIASNRSQVAFRSVRDLRLAPAGGGHYFDSEFSITDLELSSLKRLFLLGSCDRPNFSDNIRNCYEERIRWDRDKLSDFALRISRLCELIGSCQALHTFVLCAAHDQSVPHSSLIDLIALHAGTLRNLSLEHFGSTLIDFSVFSLIWPAELQLQQFDTLPPTLKRLTFVRVNWETEFAELSHLLEVLHHMVTDDGTHFPSLTNIRVETDRLDASQFKAIRRLADLKIVKVRLFTTRPPSFLFKTCPDFEKRYTCSDEGFHERGWGMNEEIEWSSWEPRAKDPLLWEIPLHWDIEEAV